MQARKSFPISIGHNRSSFSAILCISYNEMQESKALLAYGLKQISPKAQGIRVEKGFFGDPLLIHESESSYQASVSHSSSITGVIVTNACIPIGLDIEKIKPRDYKCYFTDGERSLIQAHDKFYQPALETLLWATKEALSKAIRLGFTVDVSIYTVKSIQIKDGIVFFKFVHFPRFQCQGIIMEDEYALAIAYPLEVDLLLTEEILSLRGEYV
ncbi:4'-phosphopantetheinyl transferase superfamily protein [Marivirga sp. S37H4]|uniref:4'-phosphopantetheinyl transferase superfamily protein n=1 Tax=Marivirga aurantiaca TaxID=2802615 RepID=A0A934WYF4_9BACT|nr:4'-phosphopantetheinyl transferase superfamily protein [Marivirga aurantiaca]MBK6265309.1 4'-phosphopantetheinyl transferase superfamily protein [Marivirga aurantiaca]